MNGGPEMKPREMKKLKITKKKKTIEIEAERNDQMKEREFSEVQYLMKPPKQRAQRARARARGRATKGGKKHKNTKIKKMRSRGHEDEKQSRGREGEKEKKSRVREI